MVGFSIIDAKTVIVYSLIALFFLVENIIPLKIGCPLSAFLCTVFYYFIGWKSIGFFYVLLSANVAYSFPGLLAVSDYLVELAEIPNDKAFFLTAYLIIFIYGASLMWLYDSRIIIRKFKIINRLIKIKIN